MQNRLSSFDYLWRGALVALSFIIGLQILRVFFVLIVNNFVALHGNTITGLIMAGVMLSPLLIIPLNGALNPLRALVAAVIGLVLIRLIMQITLSPSFVGPLLAILGLGLTLIVWTLLLAWLRADEHGGMIFIVGMLCGFALDTTLLTLFSTWDFIWQPGIIPLFLTIFMSVALIVSLWQASRTFAEHPHEVGWKTILLLPYVIIQVIFFQNLGFVISASGLQLPLAAGMILLADTLALWAIYRVQSLSIPAVGLIIGSLMLILLAGCALVAHGIAFIPLLFAGQLVGALLIGAALNVETTLSTNLLPTAITMTLSGLLLAAISLGYYAVMTIALPLTSLVAGIIGAALLIASLFVALRSGGSLDYRPLLAPLLLLIIPAGVFFLNPAPKADSIAKDKFRVVSYNVHYGVNAFGALNLEAIAQLIEAQDADVVTLQEVARGVIIGGGADMATWLARRLDMPYVFVPGRDWQLGNVTLSRFPLNESRTGFLTRIGNNTRRSYLLTTYNVGDTIITVINTHLSNGVGPERRQGEVQEVLTAWERAPFTIIAGDMNAFPGKADVQTYLDAGFSSAQDEAGDPTMMTYSSTEALFRIDWIFGTPDFKFVDFQIPPTTASDHLPIVATVQIN